ncbi:ribosome maturation factor RimM [Fodinicurvata sp. EGI_FJ10296]|uniref:ribosome maturation factor RimM n=1 Tax=Fodinicurvata sp. EGI_FJ10296 TaxID=3231908 RepID=UPI00345479E8
MTDKPELVCVGEISATHGVRGLVRIRPFTEEPDGVLAYGSPTDATGSRRFDIDLKSWSKGAWIASIEGVGDRTAAEKLRGTRLWVPRDRLPPPDDDDSFYYHDLIGLSALLPDRSPFGRVRGIANHGAGDVLEIEKPDGETVFVLFTRQSVPQVDVPGGLIVVDPPPMTGDEDSAPDTAESSAMSGERQG